MSNIGPFKKVGEEFHGDVNTLEFQAKDVRIVPNENRTTTNAPSHIAFLGKVEIGVAWPDEERQ